MSGRRATQGLLGLAIGLALVARLAQITTRQREIYGDIAIVFDYVDRILAGDFPSAFILSAGPLYHYLIAPYVALGGESYLTLKLASVLVSLGALAGTWLLARRLAGAQFAALAVLVAGTGSWLLIFSRLGNSQIVVPVLATISIWLVVRFAQERRQRDLALSAVVAALGLYAYPQAFPLAPIAAATLVALRWTGAGIRWGDVGRYLAYAALAAVPFAVIVASDPAAFTGDYIGGKLGGSSDPLGALLRNAGRVAGSLHLHGDSGSRDQPGRRAAPRRAQRHPAAGRRRLVGAGGAAALAAGDPRPADRAAHPVAARARGRQPPRRPVGVAHAGGRAVRLPARRGRDRPARRAAATGRGTRRGRRRAVRGDRRAQPAALLR